MTSRGRGSPSTAKVRQKQSTTHLAAGLKPTAVPAYNLVFEKLVKNEKDIVGQLAYSLYKQSKQQYLREFQNKNHRVPSDSEIADHVDCAELPVLDRYRDKATLVFSELMSQTAAEKQDELEKHFKARLWQFINRHQPESFAERSWFKLRALLFSGLGGVVGNLLTTLFVLLFLFWAASNVTREEFTRSAKESLVSGMAEIIGVNVIIDQATRAVKLTE